MADRLQDVAHQERDTVRSLEFFVEMLGRVKDDGYYWKWATIALHNTCHGFMVLALEGTWSVGLLPPKARRRVLQQDQGVRIFDDRVYSERIMGFIELFASVQSVDDMTQNMISEAFVSTAAMNSSMQELNNLRNEHLHFRAMTYIRDVPAFVPMSLNALEVVDSLLNKSGNIGWTRAIGEGEPYHERAVEALEKAREELVELENHYRSLNKMDGEVNSNSE
jgi:hypothetical protein